MQPTDRNVCPRFVIKHCGQQRCASTLWSLLRVRAAVQGVEKQNGEGLAPHDLYMTAIEDKEDALELKGLIDVEVIKQTALKLTVKQ